MKKKKQTEEKCLLSEAQDKCQCSFCKQMREMRDFNIKWAVQNEIQRIMCDVLMEEKKKFKFKII